jgi:hypothetical protein
MKCVRSEIDRKGNPDENNAGTVDVGATYDKYVPILVRIVQLRMEGG